MFTKGMCVVALVCVVIFYAQGQDGTGDKNGDKHKPEMSVSDMTTDELFELSLEELLNLEITVASKSAEKIFDAPGVVTVITSDELTRFGGITLKDALERVPSLIASTVYMTDRSVIAARGDQVLASSSHILLLINGRPVRESLEGGIKSETYEAFPINIIERIEVIRGPGSVLYGSNAFSAVINVITKNPDDTLASITGITGFSQAYGVNGHAMIKKGDFGLTFAGRHFQKQDWETTWRYPDPNSSTGSSAVDVNIPNVGTGLYFDMNYKNLRFMSSFNQWEHYYFVTSYAFLFPAHGTNKWKKGFADLGYRQKISEKWEMDFNVTYTKSTFDVSSWPGSSRDSYELVGEWANYINPSDKLGIVIGGTYNYFNGVENVPGLGDITNDNRNSVALYSQLDYQVMNSLKLIGGIQANKVEGIDLDAVPRLGLIYYITKNLNTKIIYSEAFRAPSINELSIDFPALIGNRNLKPEKVKTLDAGVNYQGEQVQLGINYFYSRQNNIIFQDRSGAVPEYNNGPEVTFSGLEFEGKYYVNRQIFLSGSMLYQNNEDKEGNENVTPIANFGLKTGVSYESRKGITASLFNIYQGDLDSRYSVSDLNPKAGSYNKLNLYLNFDFVKLFDMDTKNGISLFIQGDNMLDSELWFPEWGDLVGESIPVDQGRAVYAGLKLTLN